MRRSRTWSRNFSYSWQSLDLKRLPTKAVQQLRSLLAGDFLDRRENVLAFGTVGSGKTHSLCAVCQELDQAVVAGRGQALVIGVPGKMKNLSDGRIVLQTPLFDTCRRIKDHDLTAADNGNLAPPGWISLSRLISAATPTPLPRRLTLLAHQSSARPGQVPAVPGKSPRLAAFA